MPILAAERLIRFAALHSQEEAPSEDLKRAEREMRDADRMAEREVRSGNVMNDAEHDEDEEDELERARLAMEDEAENEGRGRSSYRSQHPFGVGSSGLLPSIWLENFLSYFRGLHTCDRVLPIQAKRESRQILYSTIDLI